MLERIVMVQNAAVHVHGKMSRSKGQIQSSFTVSLAVLVELRLVTDGQMDGTQIQHIPR